SINAAKALDSNASSYDFIAQRAELVQGLLPNQDPTLQTVGDFTAQAGDLYRVADLFSLTQPQSDTIPDIDHPIRGTGTGTLLLNGGATALTLFTQSQFDQLEFQAGANGEVNDLVAAAFTVGGASASLEAPVEVTRTRSINAAKALNSN